MRHRTFHHIDLVLENTDSIKLFPADIDILFFGNITEHKIFCNDDSIITTKIANDFQLTLKPAANRDYQAFDMEGSPLNIFTRLNQKDLCSIAIIYTEGEYKDVSEEDREIINIYWNPNDEYSNRHQKNTLDKAHGTLTIKVTNPLFIRPEEERIKTSLNEKENSFT